MKVYTNCNSINLQDSNFVQDYIVICCATLFIRTLVITSPKATLVIFFSYIVKTSIAQLNTTVEYCCLGHNKSVHTIKFVLLSYHIYLPKQRKSVLSVHFISPPSTAPTMKSPSELSFKKNLYVHAELLSVSFSESIILFSGSWRC